MQPADRAPVTRERVLNLLDAREQHIRGLLPDYLPLKRFMALAGAGLARAARDPKLRTCPPENLVECVVEAARRGLEVGGDANHCAIVPYQTKRGDRAVLLTQWQGLVFLWMRAGAVRRVSANVVFVGDKFSYRAGDDEAIIHEPALDGEQHDTAWFNDLDNVVASYAIATLHNGERVRVVLTRERLRAIRDWVERTKGLGFGWPGWLPEMCRKSSILRLKGFIAPPPVMTAREADAWTRSLEADGSPPDDDEELRLPVERVVVTPEPGGEAPARAAIPLPVAAPTPPSPTPSPTPSSAPSPTPTPTPAPSPASSPTSSSTPPPADGPLSAAEYQAWLTRTGLPPKRAALLLRQLGAKNFEDVTRALLAKAESEAAN
jgi:phage RecT family recombinase